MSTDPPESAAPPPVADQPRRNIPDRIWNTFESTTFFQTALAFYKRHEKYAPAFFFFGGVTWDASTLKRIDSWFDNAFLLVYLSLVGFLITLATLVEHGKIENKWLLRYRTWYPATIQFFLGALFSAYVIYYSQSASLSESSLFLLLLVGLLISNEFIHRRLVDVLLLYALFFLACFSFFVFFIPIVTRTMSYGTFLASGVLSLMLVSLLLTYLKRRGVFENLRQLLQGIAIIVGLFGLLNVFYILNWIPPVPLALRHGGIYHDVQHIENVYHLTFEKPRWYRFWAKSDKHFRYREGDFVHCFAAVFAPTRLKKQIYHEWQYFDAVQGRWIKTDRISYPIVGSRYHGYRGYTRKGNVHPGKWRIDVETEEGLVLGRISFYIEPSSHEPLRLKQSLYR